MKSYEEVLEQYTPMLSAVIRKLHIYRDFEHFRQAGRVALWQAWLRFDETKGDFAPYAYRSIYGAMLDELKREARFSTNHVPAEDDILELVGANPQSEETLEGLEDLLAELTSDERELVILLYSDRVSQSVCATHIGISVAGVKKRRERLLRKLRGQLNNAK
ncbi:sigma-70 family RNA polymerase sigma factor [Sporosarcina aquimarina]|uniref:sigma-70 family RNA polymerase sigma factor n=1 Tax=Sporosarcina aquimarina TaxID=114975 RepID=UPI002041162A|nr:sigma-70 family RNA polymerase sigma factor [Sporosarcina aquimarina]MCM3756141.1 sigma-70 family RNA polymerase sigma factor [Sporosarcina aquimarina]